MNGRVQVDMDVSRGWTLTADWPVVKRHVDLVVKASSRRTEADLEKSGAPVVRLEEMRNAKAGFCRTYRHFQVSGAGFGSVD